MLRDCDLMKSSTFKQNTKRETIQRVSLIDIKYPFQKKKLGSKTQQLWTVESCGLSDVGIDIFLGKGNGGEDLGKQRNGLNSILYFV